MTRTDNPPVFPAWPAAVLALAAGLLLGACSNPRPAPVEDREVETRVRAPASDEAAGVQVYPLKNPAVAQLSQDAQAAEAAGDLSQATVLLERALRIQPRDPELLQQMAEVQLQRQDWEQALSFAVRSYDIGPRVGEICARNWRTIGVARDHLGDARGASEAVGRAEQCMVTRPRGL